jgi:hypothetical protein
VTLDEAGKIVFSAAPKKPCLNHFRSENEGVKSAGISAKAMLFSDDLLTFETPVLHSEPIYGCMLSSRNAFHRGMSGLIR